MPLVRVYLTTYRRNELLKRAVRSLLAQTFSDWVCELHNDDPGDDFPGELVKEINDPRISCHRHTENLGPVRSFNLFFQPISEPYFSLLEDDNWWEPHLLQTLLDQLSRHQEAVLAWANMQMWRENPDGSWENTGQTVWDKKKYPHPVLFRWPDVRQVYEAIHSNGAMLVRSGRSAEGSVPETLPFFCIEPARERLYAGGLLLVPDVLANFALTLTTAKRSTLVENEQVKILLAWSFVRNVNRGVDFWNEIWDRAQGWPVRDSNTLVFAFLLAGRFSMLIRHARLVDWLFFFASILKHPSRMVRYFFSRSSFPELARFLDVTSAAQNKKSLR